MILTKLKLRGAIGIMKGLGREEIEIDLTQLNPGLIAITGKNGSGKTTVIENLHPFRCMRSRTGSLQSHFYLKDSYRITEFLYEGKNYQSKIMIDALTGGSEAYLYENGNPLNDGKLTTYDEALENLLGSQELFFNSVFSGQKSKGIAELKPADRRKLFYELLNLTVYEQYLENAKSNLKTNEIKLAEIEGQINSIDADPESLKELETSRVASLNNIANTELKISKVEEEISKLNTSIREVEIEVAKLEEKQKANEDISQKIEDLKSQADKLTENHTKKIMKLDSDLQDTKKLISNNQNLLQNKEQIDRRVSENKKINDAIKDFEARIKGISSKKDVVQNEHNELNKVIQNKNSELSKLATNKGILENNLASIQKQIGDLARDLELKQSVDYKSQLYLPEYLDSTSEDITSHVAMFDSEYNAIVSEINRLEDEIEEKKEEKRKIIFIRIAALKDVTPKDEIFLEPLAKLNELEQRADELTRVNENKVKQLTDEKCRIENDLIEVRNSYAKKEGSVNSLTRDIEKKSGQLRIYQDEIDLLNQEIEAKRKQIDSSKDWDQQKEALKEAETNVKILTEKMENILTLKKEAEESHDEQFEKIKGEILGLDEKLDQNISVKISELKNRVELEGNELSIKKTALTEMKSSLDYLKGVLSDAESQIKQIEDNKRKIEELNVKKVSIQSEIKDWTFLSKAFDKTGIPVLKLENSGFEITTIANDLLSLFENKFRIVFETTKLKSNKKDYKESFDINIVEEDGVCEISNKSGGQQVWLETAIQSAISLVVRQQGRNIQTSFLDEKDGALDLANAYSYIEMIQKAHQMSGVHNTFVITHRTELLDFIPQQIKLADGVLSVLN